MAECCVRSELSRAFAGFVGNGGRIRFGSIRGDLFRKLWQPAFVHQEAGFPVSDRVLAVGMKFLRNASYFAIWSARNFSRSSRDIPVRSKLLWVRRQRALGVSESLSGFNNRE